MYERKVQYMTDALPKHFLALLQLQKSKQNVLTANHSRLPAGNEYRNKSICFIQTAQIQTLCYLSSYHNSQILFSEMTRDDIIIYLDSTPYHNGLDYLLDR